MANLRTDNLTADNAQVRYEDCDAAIDALNTVSTALMDFGDFASIAPLRALADDFKMAKTAILTKWGPAE